MLETKKMLNTMHTLNCAVIGVGYLGRFHAQKYLQLPNANLVGVCDHHTTQGQAVATELGVPFYADYRELFGQVDAVSIAASTQAHYAIAKDCLLHGVHVLIEKPMTETVAQAQELIQLSKKMNVKLQVGHLERFNPARIHIEPYLNHPLFIESQRLAPFTPRGADVNVILDLMIHDIDLIQTMVNSPLVHIEAHGAPILSSAIDIANARLTFENQCVANVSASRVSFKKERKTRIFQANSYLSIDYQEKSIAVFKKGSGELFPGIPDFVQHECKFEQGDALLEEIKAFLRCIQDDTPPLVTAEDGCNALATAEKITRLIHENLEKRQHAFTINEA